MDNFIKIIILLPLVSFLISGVFYKKLKAKYVVYFTSFCVFAAAVLSCIVFYDVVFQKHTYDIAVFRWLDIEKVNVSWSIYVDVVSVFMLVVVNIVSAVVHIYSAGYMHDDKGIAKFMSYLSLFTFFMLLLVTSNNLVQLFCGWEGVGLCSYLLIGYWHKKDSANNAALKAFWVNRIADVFFLIGLFSLFIIFESFSFTDIFSKLETQTTYIFNFIGLSFNALDVITLLLFIGCMGKSAQIIFHVWLPDAMEGPTPVSALIHAATMVTAGVFLIVRLSPLFSHSEFTLTCITIVGSITCLFAALIAVLQNDIKKIIAYSTCSQLGYMFFACGLSAYSAAMFHLGTHAFFKALLFLGAGSVIHSLSGEQDIRRMGGIWKKIPFTYVSMIVGSLALVGIFPFAGYFSKDLIMDIAYVKNSDLGYYAYSCGLVTIFLTAVYSARLLYFVFHGSNNTKVDKDDSVSIRTALFVLSIGAIFSGLIAVYLFKIDGSDLAFWNNSIETKANIQDLSATHDLPPIIKFLPMIVSIFGAIITLVCLRFAAKLIDSFKKKYSDVCAMIANRFYFDEIYDFVFVQSFKNISEYLSSVIETKVIDNKGPNGASSIVKILSGYVSKIQTGFFYNYIAIMLLFMIFILAICLFKGIM